MQGPSPAGVEIERKFLVEALPEGLGAGEPIEQGYLAIAPDGVEVRIRRRGEATTLTVKSGPAHVRTEVEVTIGAREFETLWPLTEGRRVTKTRHLLTVAQDVLAELDVFGGDHEGLLTAEFEFASLEASERFAPPAWLGREVTGDARYANQALALDGRPGHRP